MTRDYRLYLDDILEAIGKIEVAQLSKLALWRRRVGNQDRILGYREI